MATPTCRHVPLIEFTADRTATSLTVRQGTKAQTYRAPDATSTFPHEVSISGAVVFAGYGITAPELNYDDYKGIDARGKIVLIFNHEPQENDADSVFNGKGNTRYTNLNPKIAECAAARRDCGADDGRPEPSTGGGPRRGPGGAAARSRRRNGREFHPRRWRKAARASRCLRSRRKLADSLFAAAGKTPPKSRPRSTASSLQRPFDIPNTTIELRTVLAERRRATTYNVAGLVEGSDPVSESRDDRLQRTLRPRRHGARGHLSWRR